MRQTTIDLLNNTWKPLLALIITVSVFLIYILYPILYPFFELYHSEIKIPESIFENLNALLLTGGALAGIRTLEKKLDALEKKAATDSKFENFLLEFNKFWRPLLAYEIVISTIIAYICFPLASMCTSIDIKIPDYYDHLNALLITGGILAGLKAIERKENIDSKH